MARCRFPAGRPVAGGARAQLHQYRPQKPAGEARGQARRSGWRSLAWPTGPRARVAELGRDRAERGGRAACRPAPAGAAYTTRGGSPYRAGAAILAWTDPRPTREPDHRQGIVRFGPAYRPRPAGAGSTDPLDRRRGRRRRRGDRRPGRAAARLLGRGDRRGPRAAALERQRRRRSRQDLRALAFASAGVT